MNPTWNAPMSQFIALIRLLINDKRHRLIHIFNQILNKFNIYFDFYLLGLDAHLWVLQSNILIYDFSCLSKMWMTFHNGTDEWFIASGFFHDISKWLNGWISFHSKNSWMVYHQCGFFHVSLIRLILSTCSHTGSSWMVYHQCVFFCVSSRHLLLSICR